jgi:glucose/arabinose dehydrogenase
MSINRIVRRLLGLVLTTIVFSLTSCASDDTVEDVGELAQPATVPSGFTDTTLVTGLSSPTAMAFAPDGRLFICQQGGQLRVFKNGALLSTPFLTVTVSSSGERGLLGVTFDPNFATNNFVYVYYTATTPAIHNRISRFTANGDVAVAGSEVVLMDLENLSAATNHNGGAMHFGPDGKLYIAVGENANRNNASTLANRLGKMLRINSDGSIPTDNPFFGTATGANRSIWALGLRNPFTFAFQRGTTRMFINDVGEQTWEEINDGIAGSNYGWPATEGETSNAGVRSPLFAYGHGTGSTTGCAITGGTFYNPTTVQFGPTYVGKYFFADFCSNWIRIYDPAADTAQNFASSVPGPVDLRVGPDGMLYYLGRGGGGVLGRVQATSTPQAPQITAHPANRTVAVGQTATFSVSATGSQPLSYQWQRGTTNIAGATSPNYSLTAAAGDNGATFRVVVTNSVSSVTSNSATLTVSTNAAPVASITAPASGTMFSGGDTINYAGTGTDAEDGTLPASAFTWEVVFHHDTHTHPFMAPTSGATSGSFTIPRVGHVETNVFYRIHLTVRDSAGLTHTVTRDITPRLSTISLRTNPAGLQVTLDGTPVTTPADIVNVVGNTRQLGVVSPQTVGGTTYTFSSWSDGGAATHNFNIPSTNTTYTATYTASTGGGLTGQYFDNMDFTNLRLTRTDATVNFNFGSGSPDPLVGADTFSVRWTGTITPQFSQAYTLYTTSDDGIRVNFNGALIINNFTDHGPTENSGVTAVLTAGQAYPIQIDFYENGGGATATLSWSSASQPKQIVPQSRLAPGGVTGPTFPILINFQLAGAPTPAGYVADTGLPFGTRSGLSFGWNTSHTDVTRDRNINANQLLDTLCHFHSGASWEIAVPNGTYNVLASIGDAQFASAHTLIVEGVTYWNASNLNANQFLSNTRAVTVSDGRLTLTQGSAADKSTRINYIEIRQP